MTLLAVKGLIERRPWRASVALMAFVLAVTGAGALIHHGEAGFLLAVFTANVAHVALQFARDPSVDRGSLFMRRR